MDNKKCFSGLFYQSNQPKFIVDFELKKIIDVNEKFLEYIGYSRDDLIGKNLDMVSDIPSLEQIQKDYTTQNVCEKSIAIIDKEGKTTDICVYIDYFSDEKTSYIQFSVINKDDTQIEMLSEYFNYVFFEMTSEFQIAVWNRAAEKFFRISSDTAVGKNYFDLFPQNKGRKIEEVFNNVLRGKESGVVIESNMIDGESFFYETSVYKEKKNIVVFIRDVSDEKKLIDELMRVNRDLQMTGKCNEALVYADEQNDLLRKICRIIVEEGSYRYTWISLINESENQIHFPYNDIFVPQDFYYEVKDGNGENKINEFFTECQQTGEIVFVDDVKKSNFKSMFCMNMLRYGIKSFIILPLKIGVNFIGFFTIFSNEANVFDNHEMNLLKDLSDHISYGIMNLRIQFERRALAQSLIESEEKYRALMNHSSEAIVLYDTQWNLMEMNQMAENIAGYNKIDLLTITEDVIFSEENKIKIKNYFEKNIDNLSGSLYDLKIVKKDGMVIPVDLSFSVINYGEHQLIQVIARDMTYYKETELKIKKYQDQLRDLASELTLAEERERRRLANILHDTVVQNLAISKIQLGMLNKKTDNVESKELLDKTYNLINVSIQQSRTLMSELSPPLLFELGYSAALEWLTDTITEKFGHKIYFIKLNETSEIAQDSAIILFQAVRELLMNAVKHSQASRIEVLVEDEDGNLKICVKDNGIGFDTIVLESGPGKDGGFGLFSIQERISFVDGSINIHSEINKGSSITLLMPIVDKEE